MTMPAGFEQSRTFGPAYDERLDAKAISEQHRRIREHVLRCGWVTVHEIRSALGDHDPENSIQAQLRHLRKKRFGGYCVARRRRGSLRTSEYKVRALPEADMIQHLSKTEAACVMVPTAHEEAAWKKWWRDLEPFDHMRLTERSLQRMMRSAFDCGLGAGKETM